MIQAKLFILDQEIQLLSTDMRYMRTIESMGRPSARIIGGKIALCFETRDDTDAILRWMVRGSDSSFPGENVMEKGKICFYADGFDTTPTKTYEFNDAYLLNYKDSFNHHEDIPLRTTITISPAIQNYGVEHIEPWNISYVDPTADEPFQAAEKIAKPRIYDLYYEDLEGGIIKELKIGTEVNLVIISSDASGKAVNVDLSDKDHDFIHEGELLVDDLLKDLTLSGDTHKEKLKVVAQHHE